MKIRSGFISNSSSSSFLICGVSGLDKVKNVLINHKIIDPDKENFAEILLYCEFRQSDTIKRKCGLDLIKTGYDEIYLGKLINFDDIVKADDVKNAVIEIENILYDVDPDDIKMEMMEIEY